MTDANREKVLVLLLRAGALMTGSAFFAIFLPETSMASAHESLGLGEFPAAPLSNYLTRSLSAMYAFHGGLLFVLSLNVRRFKPVVTYVGWATAALGVILLGIDLHAPMPAWWVFAEGPWVIAIGLVIAGLARRIESNRIEAQAN